MQKSSNEFFFVFLQCEFFRFFYYDEFFLYVSVRFVVVLFSFKNSVKISWHFRLFEHLNSELIVIRSDEFVRFVEFVLYKYREFVRFANIICNKKNDFDEFDKCVEKFWKQRYRTWNRLRNNCIKWKIKTISKSWCTNKKNNAK